MGRMHALEAKGRGHRPPLVMLHGLSSAGVHFLPMLSMVQAAFSRVILLDLPGHGFSEAPRLREAPGFHDATLEALDRLVGEPSIVFGNSLGGYAALRYALARPHRVMGLFLASPAGAAMNDDELEALRRLFRMQHHGDALAFVDKLLSRPTRARHALAWGIRRQFRRPEVEDVLRIAASEHLLTPEDLAGLQMPTLLFWGRDDQILPARNLEFFKAHLPPHTRIEEPEGFGHSPFLDDARALSERLVRFSDEVTNGQHDKPLASLRRVV
jgi:pimeloyl-ACP methyl ester carboxylesterase